TDLSAREIGLLVPLAALCIGIGFYPSSMLSTLREPTRATAAMLSERMAELNPPKPAAGDGQAQAPAAIEEGVAQ
ncbi:MAG: hypothetical protein ACK4WH_13125, partial [Phycisphaerales bacterium]